MAYTKTIWVNNNEPYLNSTNLNKIEDGIFNNDAAFQNKIDKSSGTWTGTLSGENITATGTVSADNVVTTDITATGTTQMQDRWVWQVGSANALDLYNSVNASTKIIINHTAELLQLSSSGMFYNNKIALLDGDAEAPLGNPAQDGYLLSSLADGTRSWFDIDTALDSKLPTDNPTFTGNLTGGNVFAGSILLYSRYSISGDNNEFEVVDNDQLSTPLRITQGNTIITGATGLEYNGDVLVTEEAYATDTTGGTIKIAVIGNDGYITTDGSTPGA